MAHDEFYPLLSDEFSLNPKATVIESFIPFFNRIRDELIDITKINYKNLEKFSTDTFGEDLVLRYDSFNLFFDKNKIKAKGLDLSKVKQAFKDFLMTQNYVKRVYTEEEILANSGADYHLNCIAKGYDVTQNGDMIVLDKPGYIEYGPTGTSHGTTYSYDTHVPLLFYGWNIKKGECHEKKIITQIAPTLSQKLKITLPNGTESEVLNEILEKEYLPDEEEVRAAIEKVLGF